MDARAVVDNHNPVADRDPERCRADAWSVGVVEVESDGLVGELLPQPSSQTTIDTAPTSHAIDLNFLMTFFLSNNPASPANDARLPPSVGQHPRTAAAFSFPSFPNGGRSRGPLPLTEAPYYRSAKSRRQLTTFQGSSSLRQFQDDPASPPTRPTRRSGLPNVRDVRWKPIDAGDAKMLGCKDLSA